MNLLLGMLLFSFNKKHGLYCFIDFTVRWKPSNYKNIRISSTVLFIFHLAQFLSNVRNTVGWSNLGFSILLKDTLTCWPLTLQLVDDHFPALSHSRPKR